MYRGEINNHGGPPGSVGVWGEFPESGLAPCAFLYGIAGIRADVGGMHIRPTLPSGIRFAGVDGLMFRGHRLKITSYRTHVTIEWSGGRLDLRVPQAGEITLTREMLDRR